ncbi:hypothetical protein LSAT2_025573 [Lamellibrachia satsuma]|nr:hypothetical protein LSAT2_025573 [Lamellibrachia satsuma]
MQRQSATWRFKSLLLVKELRTAHTSPMAEWSCVTWATVVCDLFNLHLQPCTSPKAHKCSSYQRLGKPSPQTECIDDLTWLCSCHDRHGHRPYLHLPVKTPVDVLARQHVSNAC